MAKLNVGDLVLCTSSQLFDKAKVTSIDGKYAKLSNGITLHRRTLIPVNSKMECQHFDEDLYQNLVRRRDLPRLIDDFKQRLLKGDLEQAQINRIHRAFTKVSE